MLNQPIRVKLLYSDQYANEIFTHTQIDSFLLDRSTQIGQIILKSLLDGQNVTSSFNIITGVNESINCFDNLTKLLSEFILIDDILHIQVRSNAKTDNLINLLHWITTQNNNNYNRIEDIIRHLNS